MCSELQSHDWQLIVMSCLSWNPISRYWNAISTHGKRPTKSPRTESRVSPTTTTTLSPSRTMATTQVNISTAIVSLEVYMCKSPFRHRRYILIASCMHVSLDIKWWTTYVQYTMAANYLDRLQCISSNINCKLLVLTFHTLFHEYDHLNVSVFIGIVNGQWLGQESTPFLNLPISHPSYPTCYSRGILFSCTLGFNHVNHYLT